MRPLRYRNESLVSRRPALHSAIFPLHLPSTFQQPVHSLTERRQFFIRTDGQEFPVPGLEDDFSVPYAGGGFHPADFFEGKDSLFRGNERIPGQEEAVPGG